MLYVVETRIGPDCKFWDGPFNTVAKAVNYAVLRYLVYRVPFGVRNLATGEYTPQPPGAYWELN